MVKVAAIQITSKVSVENNLATCAKYIKQASEAGAKLVALPEMFATIGGGPTQFMAVSEEVNHGPVQDFLKQQAIENNIWIIGGTLPIKDQEKSRAACIVYDNHGKFVTRYDKLHLFDADTENESQRESQYTSHGDNIVTTDTPFGKLGLCVCFDLRFPELFRLMFQEQVQLVTIPSAFLYDTGKSHWEVLLRARAIENCCYIIAPNQYGKHCENRRSYGHSMIVSPFGEILDIKEEGEGFVIADIDVGTIPGMLEKFPIDKHQRIKIAKPGL